MSHATSGKERSSEKRAAVEAALELARRRPVLDALVDQGDIDEPVPHGQFVELLDLVRRLKSERERRGLSLSDVSEQSGLTRAAVSRLENGWNSNPTLDTLYRYAMALDLHVKLSPEPISSGGAAPFVADLSERGKSPRKKRRPATD